MNNLCISDFDGDICFDCLLKSDDVVDVYDARDRVLRYLERVARSLIDNVSGYSVREYENVFELCVKSVIVDD